jgi:hypothetical protein
MRKPYEAAFQASVISVTKRTIVERGEKAEASIGSGSGNLAITAKNFTPIIKAACGGPGEHCRWGRHWVCGPMSRCWCAPC